MVNVEIFFRFIVDIDFKLGNFILGFCGDNEIIGGANLEFFPLVFLVFRLRKTLRYRMRRKR